MNLNLNSIMVIPDTANVYFNDCDQNQQQNCRQSVASDGESSHSGGKNSRLFLIGMCQAGMFSKKLKYQNKDSCFDLSESQAKYDLATSHNTAFSMGVPLGSTICYSDLCFYAPERLIGKLQPDDADCGKKADIWSVGIILYLLLVGKLPFKNASNSA